MSTRLPPGPPGFGLGRIWRRATDYAELIFEMREKYGPIALLRIAGRPICLLSEPELIRQVMVTKSASFEQGPAYRPNQILPNRVLLTADGQEHRRIRKLMQPAFHRSALEGYAVIMTEEAVACRDSWRDGQTIELGLAMQELTLSIVAKAFFGVDTRVDPRLVYDVLQAMVRYAVLGAIPLGKLLMKLPLPGNVKGMKAVSQLDPILYALIRKARETEEPRSDLVSLLVRAKEEEEPSFTDQEVRDESYMILLAGHETTATALTWVFYHLAQNPAMTERVVQEIDTVLAGRLPTTADFPNLTFTRAVFEETMRLTPPIYFVGRMALEDVEIGEYLIPKGTIVQVCAMATQRDPRFYPEPETFKPERWLEPQPPERPKQAWLAFGGGHHSCIGEGFARMEMAFVLAILLQQWRIPLAGNQPLRIDSRAVYRPKELLVKPARR